MACCFCAALMAAIHSSRSRRSRACARAVSRRRAGFASSAGGGADPQDPVFGWALPLAGVPVSQLVVADGVAGAHHELESAIGLLHPSALFAQGEGRI